MLTATHTLRLDDHEYATMQTALRDIENEYRQTARYFYAANDTDRALWFLARAIIASDLQIRLLRSVA